MSEKTFTLAGTSSHEGITTYRFANNDAKLREGILRRAGHIDINLRELPMPMTKQAAIAWLNDNGITAVMPRTGRQKSAEPVQAAAVAAGVDQLEEAVQALSEEDVAFLTTQQSVEE